MTPLDALLREEIERSGPMPVSVWMHTVLSHPEHGYYATRRPIGAPGDFITAPEISQMFGELVAIWTAAVWKTAGRPGPFALVEVGPGRGTLMTDMARTIAQIPGLDPTLHLIETSASLREQQAVTLQGRPVEWHSDFSSFSELYDGSFVLIANELLDALPARQFVRDEHGWRERVVALVDGQLAFAAGALASPGGAATVAPGTIVERSPAREALVEEVALAVAKRGGAALFIDYGSLKGGTGDTLQAVRDHRKVDPLTALGLADLTTHVDFAPLLTIARAAGCKSAGTTQGDFLLTMGLLERAGRLGSGRPDSQARIASDVERLAAPDAMGELFKVMALWHPDQSRPPGLPDQP